MRPSFFQWIFAGCSVGIVILLAGSALYFLGFTFLIDLVMDNGACCLGGGVAVVVIGLLLWIRFRMSLE